MKKSLNKKSILSEWLAEAERKKRENETLSRKERKLLYYSRNNIDPKLPHNGWIDPNGKLHPLAYAQHYSFADDWIEANTLGQELVLSQKLIFENSMITYSCQLLELLGWVKIHDYRIMCRKKVYTSGKIFYESCDFGLELTDKTIAKINLLLKKNEVYRIYE